jgi:hypothetical protein
MSVRIRLEAADATELDAHEAALRSVLTIPEPGSRDYPNRSHRGAVAGDDHTQPGRRRYLDSTGIRATPAGPATAPADDEDYSPRAAAEDAKRRRDLGAEIATLRAADEDLQRRPWFPLRPGDVVLMYLPADAHSPAHGETYLAVDDDTDLAVDDDTDIAGNAMLREVSRTREPWDDDADDEPAEPEYLLRFDPAAGRWALDAQLGGVELEPWRNAPELTDPDGVAAARVWAVQHLGDLVDDPDRSAYLEWRPHNDGWMPVFVDAATQPAGADLTPFYELWFEAGPGRLTVIRAGAVVHGRPAVTAAATASKGA